jgi:phage tail-like protein
MADDKPASLIRPTPVSYYTLYEMVDKNHPLAYFSALTGGEQTIEMISYNVTDGKGNITTKFIPGQTSFAPVKLLRPMDSFSKDIKNLFADAVSGKLVSIKKNYSIAMIDGQANPLVWWHLFDAIPSSLGGFSFNEHTENNYTDFEISLQAESIVIQFEPIASDPLP